MATSGTCVTSWRIVLNWYRRESTPAMTSGLELGVVVTDDELYAVHATFLHARKERSPIRLSRGELYAPAKDALFAIRAIVDIREKGI